MYQINRLNKNTLITPREVIFHAPSNHTVDERNILQNIIIAEQRFIAPVLGRDFYAALVAEKNTTVTTGNQAALLTALNAYSASIGGETILVTDIPAGTVINASEILSADNIVLWNEHLWKLVAECVECVLIVPTWLQHTEQGQQKNNPEVIGGNGQGSVTGDLKDVKYKEDKYLQDRIDPLIEAMKYFLCKNASTYPLYTCEDIDLDGISINRKSPIIFGIYDDDTSSCEW